jgi:hypothetical protein
MNPSPLPARLPRGRSRLFSSAAVRPTAALILSAFLLLGCDKDGDPLDTQGGFDTQDTADATCVPDCDGRECGADGCGGTCGEGCLGDASCDEAEGFCFCEDTEPCDGDCPPGTICDEVLDECVTCTPDCDGRACGSDGCGGTCGEGCAEGQQCEDDSGQCGASVYGLGYWRFEGSDRSTLVDSGPHGLDGTQNPRPSRSSDVPVASIPLSQAGNAQALDLGWVDANTGGFFLVPDEDLLLSMWDTDFTVEAWVRLDSLSDTSDGTQRQVLLQKKRDSDPDQNQEYMILVQRGTLEPSPNYGKQEGFTGRELLIVFGSGSALWGVTSNLELDDNAWHFISVAVDVAGQQIRFGIDDSFETIDFEDNGRVINDGPLRVGSHQGSDGSPNHFLRGAIDELRISHGVLAPEDLLSASMPDCNGNTVWDGLDISAGTSADCNGNGAPDECDVADGVSDDCQGDGVPDECQLTRAVSLSHHQSMGSLAWRSDATYMAWLTRYDVVDGASILDAFEVTIGSLATGATVDTYVWTDPDGDGNPRDAQVLWSGTTTKLEGEATLVVDVPEIDVGSTGSIFYVGCVLPEPPSSDDFPGQFDIAGSPVAGRSWTVGSSSVIDPDDLDRDAVEFGTIEDVLFAGNWVMSAHLIAPANDCDSDGIPDDCEIQDDSVEDLDCSGGPDACEDCDGDGVLDAVELAEGTSVDANIDGVPDDCQLQGNDCDGDGVPDDAQLDGTNDCNDNGVLDACDLAQGNSADSDASGVPDECEDCNGNGSIDSADIAGAASDDCDSDGVPDECQVGEALSTMSYAYDDGTRESQISFMAADLEIAWMNHHTAQEGGEWITGISLMWGDTYPGMPAKVLVWSDPDGDGDPTDARVLSSVETRTDHVNELVWNSVTIPPTYVGPAGTSFFVGAYFYDIYGTQAVAVDVDDSDDEGWISIAFDPATLDLNDLGPGIDGTTLFQFPGLDFLLRAEGSDGQMSNDSDGDGLLDICEG